MTEQKKRLLVQGSLIVFLLFAVAASFWYVRSPFWAFRRFVSAVNARDAEALYKIAIPLEREKAGLTPAGISKVLQYCLPPDKSKVSHVERFFVRTMHEPDVPVQRVWRISWQVEGLKEVVTAPAEVRPTSEGWRVNVTCLLSELCRSVYRSHKDSEPSEQVWMESIRFSRTVMRGAGIIGRFHEGGLLEIPQPLAPISIFARYLVLPPEGTYAREQYDREQYELRVKYGSLGLSQFTGR